MDKIRVYEGETERVLLVTDDRETLVRGLWHWLGLTDEELNDMDGLSESMYEAVIGCAAFGRAIQHRDYVKAGLEARFLGIEYECVNDYNYPVIAQALKLAGLREVEDRQHDDETLDFLASIDDAIAALNEQDEQDVDYDSCEHWQERVDRRFHDMTEIDAMELYQQLRAVSDDINTTDYF